MNHNIPTTAQRYQVFSPDRRRDGSIGDWLTVGRCIVGSCAANARGEWGRRKTNAKNRQPQGDELAKRSASTCAIAFVGNRQNKRRCNERAELNELEYRV